MKNKKDVLSTEEKLDKALMHLARMDKRDRLRTWGGFFKGIISIIPIIAFIYGAWYFSQHGDEIMEQIARTAAEQAAAVTSEGANSFMNQLKQFQR